MKSNILRASVAGCAMLGCLQPAAADETGNPAVEISALRGDVAYIDVYMVPPTMSFPHTLYEGDVVGMGCEYKLTDQKVIGTFLDLLDHAHFARRPAWSQVDARTVIHIHTQGDVFVSMVLSPAYTNAPTMGTLNGAPIAARQGFGADLRAWKAQMQPSRKDPLMCRE